MTGRFQLPPIETRSVVFHRAALGDFILIWPFLRRLAPVTVVTEASKGKLANRFLPDVQWIEIEGPAWNALWRDGVDVEPCPHVAHVVSFIAEPGSIWAVNARRTFPAARFEFPPTRPPAGLAEGPRSPVLTRNPTGPVVFHVGAGSSAKRWPLHSSLEFAGRMSIDFPVRIIAGEVEVERFTDAERLDFASAGGSFINSLDELADRFIEARAYVGFDSGPTHLAAQLGLVTLALFGPTEPEVWAPIGPRVHVIAPARPAPDLTWLEPMEAYGQVRRWLGASITNA